MRQREILIASLEVADATRGILSWGIAAVHSQCVVLLWDSREEADAAVLAAVARDTGGAIVVEASLTLPSGDVIFGVFVRTADDLEAFATILRTAYMTVTGPDSSTLENPF